MNYEFPNIHNIDDVLPHIKDSPEFIHVVKDGYQVINYVVAAHETFPDVHVTGDVYISGQNAGEYSGQLHGAAVRRECRGLVFDMDGNLINRRYHKFFNVNERDETLLDKIDWSRPHVILEKLDGSMVSPCRVRDHIRWMTKMGVTDTSMEAEAFVAKNPKYALVARMAYDRDLTLIFEWCSNKNRIVLDYPEDRLVLTAVRFNDNGKYMPYDELKQLAAGFDIPLVQAWDSRITHDVLTKIVRQSENIEGVVVRFDDGHMVKIKADWYVRIHKVKSLLGQERDVVKLILNNELDDLLPVLPKEDVERVKQFHWEMDMEIAAHAQSLCGYVNEFRSEMDRKTFALEHASKFDPIYRGLIFQFWDKDVNVRLTYEAIVATILKNCGNNGSYAKVKEAFLKDVDYV